MSMAAPVTHLQQTVLCCHCLVGRRLVHGESRRSRLNPCRLPKSRFYVTSSISNRLNIVVVDTNAVICVVCGV